MRTVALVAASVLALSADAPAAKDSRPARYWFNDFEAATGWSPGPITSPAGGFAVPRGTAAVVRRSEVGSAQALELGAGAPFTAIFVNAAPVMAGTDVVYLELFTQPAALGEGSDEEFLDFGGAVLGCFQMGDHAEICALAGRNERESVWISTGFALPLDGLGRVAKWVRLTLRLDQRTGRYSVAINGQPALAGMRLTPAAHTSRRGLWLYGDATRPVLFDDLLLATVAPDKIEAALARQQSQRDAPDLGPRGAQRVTRAKSNDTLRGASPELASGVQHLRLNDVHIQLRSGDQIYDEPANAPADMKLIAYAPAYDDDGNPLPVNVTITADAELTPGTDLRQLRWRILEVTGWSEAEGFRHGAIVAEGDFRTGLVQIGQIPPGSARKATSVVVWTEQGR